MRKVATLALLFLAGCGNAVTAPDVVSPSPGSAAPTATSLPTAAHATITPSPQLPDLEGKTIQWGIYRSAALGIAFEYPESSSIYGALPKCAPSESEGLIELDEFFIGAVASASTATEAADAYITHAGSDLTIETRKAVTIGGRPGVIVASRSAIGGTAQMGRFGQVAFVANRGRLYSFEWNAHGFQCNPAVGWSGPSVYAHIIETLEFL